MFKDWKVWLISAFVGLTLTVMVRVSYELFSDNSEHLIQEQKEHAIFDDRLMRLELGKVASTAKRYTGDDHAEYAKRVDARFEAMEKRHAAHIAQVSAERIAHDKKCTSKWDKVAELRLRVEQLEAK